MIAQFLTSSSPQESENSGTQAFVTPLWPGRVRTSSLDGLIPAVFLFVFWFSLLSLKAALRPGLCMWVHSPGMVLHSFIGAGLQRGQREWERQELGQKHYSFYKMIPYKDASKLDILLNA